MANCRPPRTTLPHRRTTNYRHWTPVDRLRTAWCRTTDPSAWPNSRGWWAPEVDDLARAVVNERELRTPCHRLGRARGRAGVSLAATLADLHTLYRLAFGCPTPLSLVSAVIEGWCQPPRQDPYPLVVPVVPGHLDR